MRYAGLWLRPPAAGEIAARVIAGFRVVASTPATAAADRSAAAGEALVVEPLSEADCIEVGKLRPVTKPQGLSLADRACLVLAARLGVPALTSDGAFADAEVEAEVVLIR